VYHLQESRRFRVTKTLAPGIDVKADGGNILVVPSIHPNGKPYEWDSIGGAKALIYPYYRLGS
jgi:hypothetical protein